MLLNRHNLNIHKFCAKEESRFVLRALLVTKDETVATDGHRLIRVSTPKTSESLFPTLPDFKAEDIDGPVLLHADTAKEISAAIPKGEQSIPVLSMAKLGQEDGTCKAVTTNLDLQHAIQGRKVEGQFPKWEEVIPSGKPTFEINVNAGYLADLAAFVAKFSDSGFMRLQFFGPTKAIRMDAEDVFNSQGVTAVLMPVSASTSAYEYCYKNGKKA